MTGVYYPYMASIVGKRRGTQTYYYLREMARVEGKPKVVWQQYLGKAADIAAAVAETRARVGLSLNAAGIWPSGTRRRCGGCWPG